MFHLLKYKLLDYPEKNSYPQTDEIVDLANDISMLAYHILLCAKDCRDGTDKAALEDLFRVKLHLETALEIYYGSACSPTEKNDEENR